MNSSSEKKERSKVIGLLLLNAIQSKDMPLLQRLLSKLSGEGNVEAVAELLKKQGIDLNVRADDGYTPIMVAAWRCQVGVVKVLLEQPTVNLDYLDQLGRTIEDLVGEDEQLNNISSGLVGEIKKFLVEEIKQMIKIGRDNKDRVERWVTSQSMNGMICAAIHNGDLDSVLNGLKLCTIDDLNRRDINGYSPLHWACVKNNKDITKLLLENEDVDVNSVNKDGKTPDMLAAWICSNDCLKLLLQNDRVDILNREAELVASAGKAFVCTNEQKNETTAVINEEIARRKSVAENKDGINVEQSSKPVAPKVCLFHLHQRRMKNNVKQDFMSANKH